MNKKELLQKVRENKTKILVTAGLLGGLGTIGASCNPFESSATPTPRPAPTELPTQTPWVVPTPTATENLRATVQALQTRSAMFEQAAVAAATRLYAAETSAAPATRVPTTRPAVAPATPTVVNRETFLSCDTIKQGGPVKVSRPMPEVPVSSLRALWPNGIPQNVFGSAIHSLVTQEPGAIIFSPDQKGNPDLQKVVKDGYAFWIGPENQWVLGSNGTVNVAANVTTLMASFGEGSLRIGSRTYYFPQEDKNGGTEYIVLASTKGNRGNITSVEANCLIAEHNQFNAIPNGRPDVPASAEFLQQQVDNSHTRANRVVFVTIDPSRDVMTVTEHPRGGNWNFLSTNVNVNK